MTSSDLRILCISFFLLTIGCTIAPAASLRSPWGGVPIDPNAPTVDCAPASPLPKVLVYNGYYTDAHHSVVDPEAKAAYEAASGANEVFVKRIGRYADEYQVGRSESAAECAFSLLQQAAEQNAFGVAHLGKEGSRQGYYVQAFYLDGLSLAYLKIRPALAGSARQRDQVQSWLLQLAESTRAFFDDMARQNAGDGHNNLTYWGALAVTATGIATNRQDLFDWGVAKYRAALIEISADGTLPLELDRAAMALHYHLFAVAPLVLIAELGRDNDLDLYAEDNGALHRLVKQTISGLLNPEWFTEKTHVAQEVPSELDGSVIGWAVPYEARFPNPAISSLLRKASSTGYWQLGGLPPK